MSQQVQELIDKIKNEGVQAAEQKASEIEDNAHKKAEEIIRSAQEKADDIIRKAEHDTKKMEESTDMALKQASRDTLLSLRQEIEKTLQKVVQKEVSDALTSDSLSSIIATVIKGFADSKSEDVDIQVVLNKKDLDKLKDGAIAKLQKQVKGSFKVQSSSDASKGLLISFDGGKSIFDFSDESLTEYFCTYLNAQAASLLKN